MCDDNEDVLNSLLAQIRDKVEVLNNVTREAWAGLQGQDIELQGLMKAYLIAGGDAKNLRGARDTLVLFAQKTGNPRWKR